MKNAKIQKLLKAHCWSEESESALEKVVFSKWILASVGSVKK